MALSVAPAQAASASISGTDALGTITMTTLAIPTNICSADVTFNGAQSAAIPVLLTFADATGGFPHHSRVRLYVINQATTGYTVVISSEGAMPPGITYKLAYLASGAT